MQPNFSKKSILSVKPSKMCRNVVEDGYFEQESGFYES